MPLALPLPWSHRLGGLLLALLLSVLSGLLIVRGDIAARREAFQNEARVAHRLLSQRMAQHDAILATLALGEPAVSAGAADPGAAGGAVLLPLPAGYPQLISAQRAPAAPSGDPAPTRSRWQPNEMNRDVGRYALEMVHQGMQYRLQVDAMTLTQDTDWPWPSHGPVRVTLDIDGRPVPLQPGAPADVRPAGLTEGFQFVQALASDSQPFVLRAQRWTGPAEWPWGWLLLSTLGSLALVGAGLKWLAARAERQRAAQWQRLSQVSRLNTLGELAAGMAHELNQPLTALLSGTQAALRVLREAQADGDPQAVSAAVPALELAAAQARRAADVVARLRGLVQQPSVGPPTAAVDLGEVVQGLLIVMAPDLREHGVAVECVGHARAVRADRVALEQILHNLLLNAAQALHGVAARERRIRVSLQTQDGQGVCSVQDSGPGIAPEHLARIFEPFFTTRAGGLGLGLPLCQTLAQAMGGQLTAGPAEPRGAVFRLSLPLATTDQTHPAPRP